MCMCLRDNHLSLRVYIAARTACGIQARRSSGGQNLSSQTNLQDTYDRQDMLANTVAALTVCVVVFWTMDQAGALPRPADEDDNPLALSNSDMRRIVSALVREVDQLAAEKRAAQRVFGPGKWKRDCSTLTCFNQKLAHELAMDNQRTDTANPYSPGRKRRSAEEESDQ
ncbi:uncharacterized protein LOC144910397 [Branchiostoma floridae x Branchiostoma belcheri]